MKHYKRTEIPNVWRVYPLQFGDESPTEADYSWRLDGEQIKDYQYRFQFHINSTNNSKILQYIIKKNHEMAITTSIPYHFRSYTVFYVS